MIPPIAVFSVELTISFLLAAAAYYVVGRNWDLKEEERTTKKLESFRNHVSEYWFGEVTGRGKPLRDLILASEISTRLTEEVRKWLTVKEFEQRLKQPPSPDKFSSPEKGWWWRLDKLFRRAESEFALNREHFLTPSDTQIQTLNPSGPVRMTVFPDLTVEEFQGDMKKFDEIRRELRSVISSLYASGVLKRGITLGVFLLSFAVIANLADISAPVEVYASWLPALAAVTGIVSLFTIFYPMVEWALYRLFRDLEWSSANLVTELVKDFFILGLGVGGLYFSVLYLPTGVLPGLASWLVATWASTIGRLAVIGGISLLAILLTQHSVIYAMEKLSKRFRFEYDETFASVIRFFILIYVVLIASGAFVLGFHSELGISTPDTVIIVYTVIGTLITAAVGYASRDSIEGFFAGLMLRVNPTFEVGDRIILEDLPDKRICDVRDIGLRTVRLYDIMSNTEIFVPNGKLSGMIVTNVSRPDLELRIQIPVMIKAVSDGKRKEDTLTTVERILIDVAYAEPEVNQTAVSDNEIEGYRGRISIRSAWEKLKQNHLDVTAVELWTMENAASNKTNAGKAMANSLERMLSAREDYRRAAKERIEERRLSAVNEVLASYGELRRIVDSLAESRPWLRDDEYIRTMKDELSKEPVVYSTFGISDGTEFITATLAAFATNLQRRFEVENRLNKAILERLGPRDLLVGKSAQSTPR